MLKINIIVLGKNKDQWVADAIAHYLKLLKKYATVSFSYIPGKKLSDKLSDVEAMKLEADLIRKRLISRYQIALSEHGSTFTSEQFAGIMSNILKESGGACDFVIGGIYGLDKSFIKSCHRVLSLSPMTMSHQIVRPVFLEQLYRGFSILAGGKYHR